ncbi:MAG TPA: Ig-like domain-containing protein, partial [Pyrinomonadaceae bacterium]|nr:Ig-like domain-containing protein [Pyrinomonadaceae bacterium]
MSRFPKSKFAFALTSISKKGLLTALSATTTLGMLVFLVAAMYAGGNPVAAQRLQNDSVASLAKNYGESAQQSITSATQLSSSPRSIPKSDKSENVLFNHRRAIYSGLLNLVVPTVTASKTDALFTDVDGDTMADPGDTLEYTVGISASGEDATGVTFSDTVDPNTTFVPGSLTASPVALDDSYSATGNVRISISAPGVLGNDFAGLPSASITGPPIVSVNGGNVTLNPDGSFIYNPPAGFEGVDTFSYTLTNSAGSNTGTVSITVSGMIWFVNNNASCPCDGRLTSPFNTLASFQAVNNGAGNNPASNDNIFLYESNTDYVAPVTLLGGQRFIGQDATASLSSITGLTPPAGSDPLPATNSGNGVVVNITSATTAITLASDNLLRGFSGGNATADITGAMFGSLIVSDVTLNGTGQALDLNVGTLAAAFDSISSTDSATTGISLANAGGSLTSPTTTLTNSTGVGLSVDGSSAALNFGNTNSTGSGSTGVSLTSNTGSLTFGSLNISPDGNQRGLLATNNTMIITSTSGAVSTSGATAVEITHAVGTTPLVMSLTSVAATGGPNGIFLSNTSGSFTVAGGGGSCTFTSPTCSGGRITTTTGADNSTSGIGVYLNNVTNVSLIGMRIDNHPNFGIRGHIVNGFTLQTSVIDGNNGTSATADADIVNGEDSVRIINLIGSALIDDSFIGGGYEQNLRVVNDSGTLNRLTVSDSSIGDLDGAGAGRGVDATNGDDNVNFEARNASTVMNVTMTNNILNNARGDVLQTNSGLGASMDVVFRGNTVSNNHPNISVGAGGAAITGLGAVTYDVSCNSFRDSHDIGLNLSKGRPSDGNAGGNWSGTIFNNKVGVTGVGSSAGFTGINVSARGNGTHTVLMKNNTVRNYDGGGIVLEVVDANTSAPVQLTLNASLIGNLVAEPNADSAFTGLFAVQGTVPGADVNTTLNLKLGGAGAEQNNFTAGDPADFNDVFVFQGAAPEGDFNLTQGNSASLDPTTVIINNNVSPLAVFADGGQTVVLAAPPQPAAISEACTPPLGSMTLEASPEAVGDKGSESTTSNVGEVSQTLRATHGEQSNGATALKLSATELELMTREAIARWADFGLSAGDLARMQAISTQITDLPDGELARTNKGVIEIDDTAAGFGWYFDPTPGDDSEFAVLVPNKESQATELNAAQGHMDLITVLMRQLRVALERKKLNLSGNQGWLMQNTLGVGTRRAPALRVAAPGDTAPNAGQQAVVRQTKEQTQFALDGSATQRGFKQQAKFTPRAASPGTLADVMLNIGTLPAGESLTITFRVTVANPYNALSPQVSNQGTVSGGNFESVLTDDPDVGGAADPTVTPIQVAAATPSVSVAVSPASTAEGGANLMYTFTRTGSTASALNVD